jgi:hypothetical protein
MAVLGMLNSVTQQSSVSCESNGSMEYLWEYCLGFPALAVNIYNVSFWQKYKFAYYTSLPLQHWIHDCICSHFCTLACICLHIEACPHLPPLWCPCPFSLPPPGPCHLLPGYILSMSNCKELLPLVSPSAQYLVLLYNSKVQAR